MCAIADFQSQKQLSLHSPVMSVAGSCFHLTPLWATISHSLPDSSTTPIYLLASTRPSSEKASSKMLVMWTATGQLKSLASHSEPRTRCSTNVYRVFGLCCTVRNFQLENRVPVLPNNRM